MGLSLDTSAVIGWFERKDERIRSAVQSANVVPWISVISLGELHAGVAHASASAIQSHVDVRTRTLKAARSLRVSYVTDEVAECFGELSARLTRRVASNDRWIVATALVNSHTLVTQDETLLKLMDVQVAWNPIEILYCKQ